MFLSFEFFPYDNFPGAEFHLLFTQLYNTSGAEMSPVLQMKKLDPREM